MVNAKSVLAKMNINGQSYLGAIQEVRDMIDTAPDKLAKAASLLFDIAGVHADFANINEAVCIVQTVTEAAVRNEMFDPELAVDFGRSRYARLRKEQAWLYASGEAAVLKNEQVVVEGIDTKVEVNANGKIKKGGKQILAAELYKKYVLDADVPLDNKQFIEVLVRDLGMSKAGATTYAWNCRKQQGEKQLDVSVA